MAAGRAGAWTETGIGGFVPGLGALDVDLSCLGCGLVGRPLKGRLSGKEEWPSSDLLFHCTDRERGPRSESESESDLELEGDDRRVEVRGEMRGGTLRPRGWL